MHFGANPKAPTQFIDWRFSVTLYFPFKFLPVAPNLPIVFDMIITCADQIPAVTEALGVFAADVVEIHNVAGQHRQGPGLLEPSRKGLDPVKAA
jgi:hypothetical protein